MQNKEIYNLVIEELKNATNKWPDYYSDIIHAAGLINEEAGESMQAALDCTYDNGNLENVKKEVIQTAAMCFRLLNNIKKLRPIKNFVKKIR